MFSIYLITNVITDKKYIGYTNNTIKRFNNHRSCGSRGTGSCIQLYQSMKKHGIDNFVFEVIHSNIETLKEAKELEIKYIEKYQTYSCGYNAHPGGTGGDMSCYDSWKQAMVKMYASKQSYEYATRGMQGKTHSLESRQKQSIARKKQWESMSKEDLQERSSKVSGSKNGMFGKAPKNCIRIEFYGIIYNSISEASRKTGHSSNFVKKHGTLL